MILDPDEPEAAVAEFLAAAEHFAKELAEKQYETQRAKPWALIAERLQALEAELGKFNAPAA